MSRVYIWKTALGAVALMGVAVALLGAAPGDTPTPTPTKFEGVINDFSPSTTSPAGPYLVSGPWSLEVQPSGRAQFRASLTMVRPNPATDTESARNFHTHHVELTDGSVALVGSTLVVTGTALITSNGNQVFPGTTVQVEINGGTTVTVSNMKLTFVTGASAHFTNQPYDGVVTVR